MLPRLRAQVLLGRPHLRAEVSSRAPGPTRIEKDRPRERDQVSISGRNDSFRLLELGDEPDGNDGHVHCRLDGAREWDLIAGADGNALLRVEAATRDVNGSTAARLE